MNACVRSRAGRFAAALLFLLAPAIALAIPVKPGHAGHWSAPERDGEGWVLEMLAADSALLYWFTYDEAGNQRWLTAVGELRSDAEGEYLAFPELVATRGARFGAAFDPDDVVREVVGNGRLRFEDCERATFGFQAYGQTLTIPLRRLAHLMGSACERPHGTTGRPSAAHAGLSGSWFDPSRSGEGYALQWINPEQAIVTWYTYDTAGRQYWLIGEGRFDAQGRIVAQVHSTRGGRFGAAFDPGQVERVDWGEVVLSIGCDGGPGDYASTVPGFGQGRQQLQRLTALHRLGCPWQAPRLTDLYEVELVELPRDIADAQYPGHSNQTAILTDLSNLGYLNDAGALWSEGQIGSPFAAPLRPVVSLSPGDTAWRVLGPLPAYMYWFRGAAQGGELVGYRGSISGSSVETVRWSGETWQGIDPVHGPGHAPEAMSADGQNLVLRRFAAGQSVGQYRWTRGSAPVELPRGPYAATRAFLVGDGDGPAVGIVTDASAGGASSMAIIWNEPGQPPHRPSGPPMQPGNPASPRWVLVRPGACSSDCRIVFGGEAAAGDDASWLRAEPWYLLADGRSAFLGAVPVPASQQPRSRYFLRGAAADGSLLSGWESSAAAGPFADRYDGFIWTQLTGMASLSAVLEEVGVPVADWGSARVHLVSPSGLRMMVVGGAGRYLLTLVPRTNAR
ncbi:MAG: hypothetical protein KF823_07665 [Xanthomonadales bacterium]|nr:hypothetical protein [Xanthomonadales bacterium]